MRANSLDLRQRIVNAYEQGHGSVAEVAESFSVSPAFVKKMLRQWRQTGDPATLAHGGGKPASLSERQRQLFKRKIRHEGDLSLLEPQTYLREQEAAEVHPSTISRALSEA
jgi:transposase